MTLRFEPRDSAVLTDLASRCKLSKTAVTVGNSHEVYRALAHLLHDQRVLLMQNNELMRRELGEVGRRG